MPDSSAPDPDQARPRSFWNEEVQTMARPELEALQRGRLSEAVGIAYERAPFFRQRFDVAGIKPGDIASLADLRQVPAFRKADLRADEAAHPPVGQYRASGLRGAVRLATSTGTTGRATYVLFTRHDIGVENELGARNFWRLGYRPGDVVVNAHPGYLNGGQANVGGVMEHLGCLSISIGPPADDDTIMAALRRLDGLTVDHWQLMPAAAVRIREAAQRRGWTGLLPPIGNVTPLMQLDLISAGMECVGFLGSTCRPGLGHGAHVAEDYAVVEVVDPETSQPVPDGERGYLVCTSLGRDNPMIRYNLEDVVRIDRSPCDCGETHLRAWWDGRGKDIVTVAGRTVLPLDVWRHLAFDAQYVLLRRRREMDRLEIRLEGAPPEDLAARIEADIQVPVHIAAIPEGSLARSSYKFERVMDVDEGESA
jgi:phenylacetate-CoA ligase